MQLRPLSTQLSPVPFFRSSARLLPLFHPPVRTIPPAPPGVERYALKWLVDMSGQFDYIDNCKNQNVFEYFYGQNITPVSLSELRLNLENIDEKEKSLIIRTFELALEQGDVEALKFFENEGKKKYSKWFEEILSQLVETENVVGPIYRGHYRYLYMQNFEYRLAVLHNVERKPEKMLSEFGLEPIVGWNNSRAVDTESIDTLLQHLEGCLKPDMEYFSFPNNHHESILFKIGLLKNYCKKEVYNKLVQYFKEGECFKFRNLLDSLYKGPNRNKHYVSITEILLYSTKITFPRMMQILTVQLDYYTLKVCLEAAFRNRRDDQVIYFMEKGAQHVPNDFLLRVLDSSTFGYVELFEYLMKKIVNPDYKEYFLRAARNNLELTKHLVQHHGVVVSKDLGPDPVSRFRHIESLLHIKPPYIENMGKIRFCVEKNHWELAHFLFDQLTNQDGSFPASIVFRLIETAHHPIHDTLLLNLLLNLLIKLHKKVINLFTLRDNNKCIFDYAQHFSKEILRFLLEEAPEEKTADLQPTLRQRVLKENSLWAALIPEGNFEKLHYLFQLYSKHAQLDFKSIKLAFQPDYETYIPCDQFRLVLLENKEMGNALFSHVKPAVFMMSLLKQFSNSSSDANVPNKTQEQLVQILVENYGVNPIYPQNDIEEKDITQKQMAHIMGFSEEWNPPDFTHFKHYRLGFGNHIAQFLIRIYQNYFDKCYGKLNESFEKTLPRPLINLIFDQLCDMPYFNLQDYLKNQKRQRDPLIYPMKPYSCPFMHYARATKESKSDVTKMQIDSHSNTDPEPMDVTQPLDSSSPPVPNGSPASLSLAVETKLDRASKATKRGHEDDEDEDDYDNGNHPPKRHKSSAEDTSGKEDKSSLPDQGKSSKEEKTSPSDQGKSGKVERTLSQSSSSSSMTLFNGNRKRDHTTMLGSDRCKPTDDEQQEGPKHQKM